MMPGMTNIQRELMTPADVATLFRVDPKTVTRWEKSGRIVVATRTPGNHRRYFRDEMLELFSNPTGSGTGQRCDKCTYLYGSPGHKKACG